MAIKFKGGSVRDFKFEGRPQPNPVNDEPLDDVGLKLAWEAVDAAKLKWLESLGVE